MAAKTKQTNHNSQIAANHKTPKKGVAWRLIAIFALLLSLAAVPVGIHIAYLNQRVQQEFPPQKWEIPARMFARPLVLFPGKSLNPEQLALELQLLNYQADAKQLEQPGHYRRQGGRFEIATRGFQFAQDHEPARRLVVQFQNNQITALRELSSQRQLARVRLQPVLIGNIYSRRGEDRVLLELDDVPQTLLSTLLAIEDRRFDRHIGVDPLAIMRAAWRNLRAGHVVEGGSTLTQQLVKNAFLSRERRLLRKINEGIMALLLERQHDKSTILQAYLNEIYLGQSGAYAIHGFGLAAQFWFGRSLDALRLDQIALLVGMIKGPAAYDPRRHPERARQRRNLVLDQLAAQGLASERRIAQAKAKPLDVIAQPPLGNTLFPAFQRLVREQLRQAYRPRDSRAEGLLIFTTLDPPVQLQAEHSVASHLDRLEAARSRLSADSLEAAAVYARARTGEILALVGGRRARYAGFNRVLDAQRPIGSLIKPFVYLEALSQPQHYTLSTLLDDRPLHIRRPNGDIWRPQNYDRQSHEGVRVLDGLVHSINVGSARLGLSVGVETILERLQKMGLDKSLDAYPSLLLGAMELSPYDVLELYQSLATGGIHQPLRAIDKVVDRQGRVLQRYPASKRRVAESAPVFLLTEALWRVTQEGTARQLQQRLPQGLAMAGKTGTTDDLRDSWFAGYSAEHVGVVWVGRDDNRPTGLTGSTAAMPIWGDIMAHIGTTSLTREAPAGIDWARIDWHSGQRLPKECTLEPLPASAGSDAITPVWVPYIQGSVPKPHPVCR